MPYSADVSLLNANDTHRKITVDMSLSSGMWFGGGVTCVRVMHVMCMCMSHGTGIEECLKTLEVGYFRLDGSTPAAQRQADVDTFQTQGQRQSQHHAHDDDRRPCVCVCGHPVALLLAYCWPCVIIDCRIVSCGTPLDHCWWDGHHIDCSEVGVMDGWMDERKP